MDILLFVLYFCQEISSFYFALQYIMWYNISIKYMKKGDIMKRIVFLIVVMAFLFTGYVYSQDCKACPSVSNCGTAKKVKKSEVKVYVSKTGLDTKKLFHKKDCLKKDAVSVTLTEVKKKGYKPCQSCFPKKVERQKK